MDVSLDPLALPGVPSLVFLSTRELHSLRLGLTTAKQEEHMVGLWAIPGQSMGRRGDLLPQALAKWLSGGKIALLP